MTRFDVPVSRYMTAPVVVVPAGTDFATAEQRLADGGFSCLAVVGDDERLAGVISRTDLLRIGRLRSTMNEDHELLTLPRQPIRKYMHGDVVTVTPQATIAAAAALMVQHHIHRVFVIDGERRPIGVVSTRDVMRAVADARVQTPIEDVMSAPVICVEASDPVSLAVDRLEQAHVRGVVVLENEWPVGVFTQLEALSARALDGTARVEQAMSCAMLCLPRSTSALRAANFALATRSRRILVVEAREVRGILTGIDFAKVATQA